MPVSIATITNSAGRIFIEERDADTNALLRRILASPDQQPVKVRLELEMEDAYDDWQRWKNTRIEMQTRWPSPTPAQQAAITAVTNRENAGWAHYLTALNEWRTA